MARPLLPLSGMNTSTVPGRTSLWIFDAGPFGPGLSKSISEKKNAPSLSLQTGPSTNTNPSLTSLTSALSATGACAAALVQNDGSGRGAAGAAVAAGVAGPPTAAVPSEASEATGAGAS